MLLTLENIGKVQKASIKLNGITVIAGKNGTGKSTVGKALYCIFDGFYKLKENVTKTRRSMLAFDMHSMFRKTFENDFSLRSDRAAREIISIAQKLSLELKENDIEKVIKHNVTNSIYSEIEGGSTVELDLPNDFIVMVKEHVNRILSVPENAIYMRILQKKLDSEFNGQVNDIFKDTTIGKIELKIKETNIAVEIADNKVSNLRGAMDLNTQVVYLDDPFILDELSVQPRHIIMSRAQEYRSLNHRESLKLCLSDSKSRGVVEDAIKELMVDAKMKTIMDQINAVCDGEMKAVPSPFGRSFGYIKRGQKKPLQIENMSTGMKSFIVLKTLLTKGDLEENGLIILDEPEVHLHPEWQLIFAELIVLLQKEFSMHILLNTHSPYFLNAIEAYSKKHGIYDKCTYYLASAENNGERAVINDVTGNLELIYTQLARPLQVLEDVEEENR